MSKARCHFGARVLGDDLVVMGGSTNSDTKPTSSIEVLQLGGQSGRSGHWTPGCQLCQPISNFAVVSMKMTPALRAMAEVASQDVVQVKRMERIAILRDSDDTVINALQLHRRKLEGIGKSPKKKTSPFLPDLNSEYLR